MSAKRTTPLRSVRTVVAGATLTAIALLSTGGVAVAGADADYPPVPSVKPPEVVVDADSPESVESASPAGAVAAGALPATGSGVDSTLMIAGSALLAGIGLAGISGLSRRRREAADAT